MKNAPNKERPRLTLIQKDREVAELYGVTATPTALLISSDARIASQPAVGPEAITELVLQLVADGMSGPGIKGGENFG